MWLQSGNRFALTDELYVIQLIGRKVFIFNKDPAAVVDHAVRVRQITGLRVVDASIFPEAISTPTNLTTIMVAERIAADFSL